VYSWDKKTGIRFSTAEVNENIKLANEIRSVSNFSL